MLNIDYMKIETIKNNQIVKKAVLLSGLFLAVFVGAFYVVNLDLSFFKKNSPRIETPAEKENASARFVTFEEWAVLNRLSGDNISAADPDGDGLSNAMEFTHFTDPNKKDTDGDKFSDKQEIANGYDPDDNGKDRIFALLQIGKINVSAPIVWSESEKEKEMLTDLEKGVAHFAKTASPGQNGNMIISGHSSNYIWAKGDYNHIFKNLDDLKIGDEITIKTIQQNGRVLNYKYKISDKFVTSPDDADIFADSKAPTITLSTCWPLGTTFRRLIVKAELVK